MLRRARALHSRLREQQEESNQRGTYSPEMHEAFRDAGFYRICQPRMFGGYEFDLPTFYRVMIEVSRGHPSAGWCLTLAASHAFAIASHWGEDAQREIFGPYGEFVAPHRALPSGTARKADGGYIVNGTWGYASGIPYSTHLVATTLIDDGDGRRPRAVNFVVPRSNYTILDDWGGDSTLGMRASGSNSARLDDVFVPSHHIVDFPSFYALPDSMKDGTPGTRLHGNPMYLGRLMAPYHASLVAPVIGAARAAIDEYEKIINSETTIFPPFVLRRDHYDFQRNFGYAIMLTDSAEALLLQACEQLMEKCHEWQASGKPVTLDDNLRLWGMLQTAGRIACDATELLFQTAGTTAARKGQPLQQYFSDVQMYRGHPSAQYLAFGPYIARSQLGMRIGLMDM